MANPVFKFSLVFEALGDQDAGWSESYYASPANLGAALTLAVNLASTRSGCTNSGTHIPYCRVTQWPLGSGVNTLVYLKQGGSAGIVGTLQSIGPLQVVKGLLRLVNNLGTFTKQPFGGMPTTSFGANGVFLPGGVFQTPFNAFLAFLASNGFLTKKLQQGTVSPSNGINASKYLIQGFGAGGVVTCTGATFAVGQQVKIGRAPRGFGLNGTFPCISASGSTFQFQGFPNLVSAVPPGKSTYGQIQNYIFTPIAANPTGSPQNVLLSGIIRSSKHNVGRVPNSPTGRRKKRPS